MSNLPEEQEPFISIVIPCYNGMATIADCLNSLEQQSYPRERFEIILVDNGSRDGTCEFVQASFPSVRLLHSAEKGSGYARNAGIFAARGELILSTDSDCVADKEWAATLVRTFQSASPSVAAIGGTILPFSEKTQVEQYQAAWISQPDLKVIAEGVRYTATPNAGFRAANIKAVGAFDGTLGFDDTDLGIRLARSGARIEYTDKALVYHRNPATLKELFEHRKKYGKFGFQLARKYPDLFGEPKPSEVSKLLLATVRRLVGDLFFKLPWAMVTGGRPRIWPLIDAAIALGNYLGYSRAFAAAAK